MSASWFFGVEVFDLNFGIRIDFDQTTNQEQLCGSVKHVSLWDSSLRKLDVRGNTINIFKNVDHSLRSLVWPVIFVTVHGGVPRSIMGLEPPPRLKQSDPTNREWESRPISIRPKRWFRILLNFAKLKLVSYTSNFPEQMYHYQECTVSLQKWILNPQHLVQNQNLENWETAVCFLNIQLIRTNVWLPKCIMFLQKSILNLQDPPAKSESWNSPSLHCLAVLPTWQYCLYSQGWWIYEINRFRRLSQALVHCNRSCKLIHWPLRKRLIRAYYKLFKSIWEQTCDNSATDFNSLSWKWWSMHGIDTL